MASKVPYHFPRKLSFDIYQGDEIRKLSVLEINNPSAFDELEHPTSGGLYDPLLGPSDQREECKSCGLQSMDCPGHVGHIELPLPVFSPVLIRTLYQILQGICFKCNRLLAPTSAIHLAIYQFYALDYGLVGVVHELQEAVSDLALVSSDDTMPSEFERKLMAIVQRATENIDLEEAKVSSHVRSVVECRQNIMKAFIKDHLSSAKRKCCHCQGRNFKISLKNNATFIHIRPVVKIQVKKEESEAEVNENTTDSLKVTNVEITPTEVKCTLEAVWQKDSVLLKSLFGMLNKSSPRSSRTPIDLFFIDVLAVSPSRFRPISLVKGRKYLNPRSVAYKEVLTQALFLKTIMKEKKLLPLTLIEQDIVNKIRGKTQSEKLKETWCELQKAVNSIFDSDMDKQKKEKTTIGVKQVLEKKEGLFRKHMMGKRVNYAARSVISPDPYIMVDEIGVPEIFAKKLTYPAPVAHWNVEKLRRAVINGPNVHPGADKVEMEDGNVVKLSPTDAVQRYSIACLLLKPPPSLSRAPKGIPKKVHRHMQNGDILLLNRQPTLHKSSIMAHRARVLPGEKTLRLHYANCKSYNADFDGDEMNAHYPQNEVARSEGHNIASVNHQYLGPKDGTPLSGLIQDHIIAGTLLTMRGKFFSRGAYQQLVYGAISFLNTRVKTLPPAMIKPEVLWSGKQVFSTVLINVIPHGKEPPTMEGKTKISGKNWQKERPRQWLAGGTPFRYNSPLHHGLMSEEEVIIRKGELLCGVIDKANIGPTPYSLVHCCYEIYGGQTSTALMTALARLFTHYLQSYSGFTLGIEDILLTPYAERRRKKIMKKAKKVGPSVVAAAFDLDDVEDEENLKRSYRQAQFSQSDFGLKSLDYEMKKKTDNFINEINSSCMPLGLYKRFPDNNLQLMIQSGAKGSTVNAVQMSCLLGQIELEGRRVPLMMNGSTLPSFRPYDPSPRAGGFIDGRFLTGIRPQEFFFHCMAGREGLIDTAVKTSRSGYLQRCLIKHLEGIVVNYDYTVRDSDGSVIQFLYGEDGLDVGKVQLLKEERMDILAKNYEPVMKDVVNIINDFEDPLVSKDLSKDKRKIARFEKKFGETRKNIRQSAFSNFIKFHNHNDIKKGDWYSSSKEMKQNFDKSKICPDPVTTKYPPHQTFGAVSERLDGMIKNYLEQAHEDYLQHNPINKETSDELAKDKFEKMVYYRTLSALAQPGEAVGLLAAQSIGEPSTQMTLNTFHFAGRGEMNVTLGIPRLREILMTASANIATPTMDLPIYSGPDVEERAEKVKVKLSMVLFKDLLEVVDIEEELHIEDKKRFRLYAVRIQFLPHKAYKGQLYVTPSEVIEYVEKIFLIKFVAALKKKLSHIALSSFLTSVRETTISDDDEVFEKGVKDEPADEGGSSDEEEVDGDTTSAKFKTRHDQELEYEEPEEEERPVIPDEVDAEEADVKIEIDSDEEEDIRVKTEHEEDDVQVTVKTENEEDTARVMVKTEREKEDAQIMVKTEHKDGIKDIINIESDDEEVAQNERLLHIKSESESRSQSPAHSGQKVKTKVKKEPKSSPEVKKEPTEKLSRKIKKEPADQISPVIKKEPADTLQQRIKKERRKNSITEDESFQGLLAQISQYNIKKETNNLLKNRRIRAVLVKFPMLQDYDYDDKKMSWCEFTIQLSLEDTKVDMTTLFEEEANKAIVYKVPNINKAFLVKNPNSLTNTKMLKTEGVNFLEIFGGEYDDTIDCTRVYSNDIHAIAKIFGIEAAGRVIVKEMKNVFATYGIEIDPRHLSLIADYMTFDGTYKPLNRLGMASNPSPLQQMTFETTMSFLQNAIVTGTEDHLKSPSARIVVGLPVKGGTGCFDLRLKSPWDIEKLKTRRY